MEDLHNNTVVGQLSQPLVSSRTEILLEKQDCMFAEVLRPVSQNEIRIEQKSAFQK